MNCKQSFALWGYYNNDGKAVNSCAEGAIHERIAFISRRKPFHYVVNFIAGVPAKRKYREWI